MFGNFLDRRDSVYRGRARGGKDSVRFGGGEEVWDVWGVCFWKNIVSTYLVDLMNIIYS